MYPASTVPGKSATTEADISVPTGTEVARVVLYIPAGYGNVLGRAPSAQVGGFALVDASFLFSFGFITAEDPTGYTTDPCAPGLHQAVWDLTLEIEPGILPSTPGARTRP